MLFTQEDITGIVETMQAGDVMRTYRGRQGCMCGCRGSYRETQRSAARALNEIKSLVTLGQPVEAMLGTEGEIIISSDRDERTLAIWARLQEKK